MLRKHEFYEKEVWPGWIEKIKQSPDRAILLHGIMGSELYDKNGDHTRWLDFGIWHEMDNLAYERLSPDGAIDSQDQFIYARSTVHPPIVQDPYSKFFKKLKSGQFNFD